MAAVISFTEEQIKRYKAEGYWADTIIADVCDRNAVQYPDEEAIVDSETRLTWAQVKQLTDRIAIGLLELGIRRGSVLLIQLYNCVDFFLIRIGCEKAGMVLTVAATPFRQAELKPVLNHVRARVVFIPWVYRNFDHFKMVQEMLPDVSDLRHIIVVGDEVPPGAISIREMYRTPLESKYPPSYLQKTKLGAFQRSSITTSSGTTGIPKCGDYLSAGRIPSGRAYIKRFKLTHRDVIGALAPFMAGGCRVLAYRVATQIGAKIVFEEKFTAEEACQLIERERITIAAMVPTMLARLLSYPDLDRHDLSSLHSIITATATLPPVIAAEVERVLGCPVIQMYGSLETDGTCSTTTDDSPEVRHNTVGKPIDGAELKIVDEMDEEVPPGDTGEITVRSPVSALSYYKNPKLTRQTWKDGWYHMGDIGKLDEAGNIILTGRKKDIIIRGGQNIYPGEIEAIISDHPDIAEVAVVKMPDLEMGEKACACVVPKPGADISLESLVSFLKGKGLAPFKLPERLEVMSELPLVLAGQKVNKRQLEQDIVGKLIAEGKLAGAPR
jgi:non-ribosomal peptide synthetase component E (peptide arylation enzyme)